MVCPNCGKQNVEPADAFCRHCGSSLATSASAPKSAPGVTEKKSVTATDSDPGKGLLLLGAAIVLLVPLFVFAVAPWMGWLDFLGSVLPWFSGALTLVGLVVMFIGFELRRAH